MKKVLVAHPDSDVRLEFSKKLDKFDSIEIVDKVRNPRNFFEEVRRSEPDVVILGSKFDTISGLDLLDRLMKTEPVPVLAITTEDELEQEEAVRALSYGAIDLVDPEESAEEIKGLIEIAAEAETTPYWEELETDIPEPSEDSEKVVVIGSSTGGPSALQFILKNLPEDLPAPVVISQHMSARYTRIFTQRVNKLCGLDLKEARDGERIEENKVYLAPGNKDMTVWRENGDLVLKLEEPVHEPTPSIDELFKSAAAAAGPNVIGVVLTGMGKDGVVGSRFIKAEGGTLIVQNRETSQIYGIGKHVVAQGDANKVLPLEDIPAEITRCL
ncbi:MAG: chemotaxis protein CheB [Candidatus Nanohaloarchaea archaeon]